ncbi:MAG: XRE family transcriptional regulator [Deltaproteobacteria bacterium]|nr:XRE family transcriptional regulator [Deltaproteobacteria bacterium]
MSTSTSSEHQVIRADGVPVAVVVPYDDYLRMTAKGDEHVTLPNEVVGLILAGKSTVRAWREHLGLTQSVVAERMGISQSAYAQMEAPDARPRPSTLRRIADAMGIEWEQME